MQQQNTLNERIERLAKAFPQIMQAFHNLTIAVSRVHELTLAQYRLLIFLQHRKQCSVNEIATSMGIAQSTASELVSRMVASALLVREPDRSDRRQMKVALSKNSEKMLRAREEVLHRALRDLLTSQSDTNQEEFVSAFEKISHLLEEIR